MRAGRIILIITAAVLIITAGILISYMNKAFPDDYGIFSDMRNFLTESLIKSGAAERSINQRFNNYRLQLNPLFAFMFKADSLSLILKSYESDLLDTGTISQFEIGENSGILFDFTFMLRPAESLSLPFFHGDALKALPGVDGALYMDFYAFDNTMNIEDFFGTRIEKIKQARKLAAPYWKHEGFGELTVHLNEFKSPYRLEIIEPKKASEEEKQLYFKTAFECFRLYTEAYLESLQAHADSAVPSDAALNAGHINDFVDILYEHDVAVKMGKTIFPEEDFDSYFLDGFWGTAD